jgi:hypothetical protein
MAALDGHVRELAWQVGHARNLTSRRRAALRAAIDRLLDRGLYLRMSPAADAV